MPALSLVLYGLVSFNFHKHGGGAGDMIIIYRKVNRTSERTQHLSRVTSFETWREQRSGCRPVKL